MNPLSPIFQVQKKISKTKNLNKDILIFGDSSAQFAIQSCTIQEITGLTSYNFSTIGNATFAGNYFLFKNYLECNKPPKFLLLMNVYDVWHRDLHSEGIINVLASNFFMDTIKTLFCIDVIDRNNTFKIVKKIVNHILPSLRYKYEIRRLVRMIIKSNKLFFETLTSVIIRTSRMKEDLMLNGGNYRKYLMPWLKINQIDDIENYKRKNLAKDIREHLDFVEKNTFHISNLNKYYFDKFIQEAVKRNIIILICFPPILHDFYHNIIANNHLNMVKSFLESIAKSNTNVILITKDFYVVPSDKLFDSIDHLDEKESLIFTNTIANRILNYKNSIKSLSLK